MELRVLKYFLSVVQEENITRAAEMLHTTQPNLSRQLTMLETELGCRLFERSGRKIILTEEGMFLHKRAKEIVELTERTEDDLSMLRQAAGGVIHIGGVETHVMKWIGETMISLRETHPRIQYDFFSGSVAEITDWLNKGLLDFGVVVAPVDMQKYDYVRLPVNDRFGLLMRKDCPLAELPCIRPEDIGTYPVWAAHQQLEGNVLSSWLGRDIQSLNIISTFNLITTPAMLVEQGLGMAFTFADLVNTSGDSPLCFRPLEPVIEADIYLIWKKYQLFTKAAEIFLEDIRHRAHSGDSFLSKKSTQ